MLLTLAPLGHTSLGAYGQAFFVMRGEGGGEILQEAGTFSGQALLLSYPYPWVGGGSSQGGRHPLTALSTVPTQYQTTRNAME